MDHGRGGATPPHPPGNGMGAAGTISSVGYCLDGDTLGGSLAESPLRCTQSSTIVLLHCILQFVLIEVLWLYHDRYYLPLLPGLIIVLLGKIKWTKVTQTVMVTGVLVYAAISVSGTIDNYRFYENCGTGACMAFRAAGPTLAH